MERGDQVEFDAVTVIEPTLSAEVTSYPVEDGTIGSDHVVRKPRVVRLECLVTETPSQALQPEGTTARPRMVIDRLREAWNRRESLSMLGDLDVIERMYITSLTYPQSADTLGSVQITLTLQEVEVAVARTATVRAAKNRRSNVRHTGKRKDLGSMSTMEPTPTLTVKAKVGEKSVTRSYAANGRQIQWSGLELATPAF
jgi:hypothetical protein